MDENDPKSTDIILESWKGKESTLCDGNIFGYSNMTHILLNETEKVTDPNTPFFTIISNNFTVNLNVDYSF